MSSQEEVYEAKKKLRLLRAARRKIRTWLYTILFFFSRPKWRDRNRPAWR